MSVRTGMYHFEVSHTALYPLRYVPAPTSTYHLVLPCTRAQLLEYGAAGLCCPNKLKHRIGSDKTKIIVLIGCSLLCQNDGGWALHRMLTEHSAPESVPASGILSP
jgi:hypothetical protein